MRCSKCNTENEDGSKFCGKCGAELLKQKLEPTPPVSQENPTAIFCPQCHTANSADSIFCDKCGFRIINQVQQPATNQANMTGKTSGAWWLMPIFMGWLGGLIAWLVVREKDKAKARSLLITGIVISVLWIAVAIAINAAALTFLDF